MSQSTAVLVMSASAINAADQPEQSCQLFNCCTIQSVHTVCMLIVLGNVLHSFSQYGFALIQWLMCVVPSLHCIVYTLCGIPSILYPGSPKLLSCIPIHPCVSHLTLYYFRAEKNMWMGYEVIVCKQCQSCCARILKCKKMSHDLLLF